MHILPLVGKAGLYHQFHLDEPWDSPHNKKLIELMPPEYRLPSSKLKKKERTNYVVPGKFRAVLCDGSARVFVLPEHPETLRAMFTRSGGERVPLPEPR